MNAQNLVTESLETLSQANAPTDEQKADITTLPLDSFRFIGGGGGIVNES